MDRNLSDYAGKSVCFGFRAVHRCALCRKNVRYCCIALCFGLLAIVGLFLFSYQGYHSKPKCEVKYKIHPDYFGLRSVEIISQRLGYFYTDLKPEIQYYYYFLKPNASIRTESKNDFQPVEANSSYVYSAYLDDRQAPDVYSTALPVVRIFTAMPRDSIRRAKRSWHCVFWYEEVDFPLVVPVAGITDLDVFDYSRSITCNMVLCSLPTTSTSTQPIAVSLINDVCQGPQNHLPIIDLRKTRGIFERLSSVENDTFFGSHNKDIFNFTICIPPLFGEYITSLKIIEFIELNRLLGAGKFVFYLTSPKPELVSCLRYYSKAGLVELNNWSIPSELENIHYNGQILAQNECLYRTMYRTMYLVNQDLDEFIVPMRTENWQTMLKLIHSKGKRREIDKAASYSFRNLFFLLGAVNDKSLNEPFKVGDYELKTLTKTTCSDKPNPWKERSKIMGRPERLLIWHVHEILDSSLVRNGDVNQMVDEEDGLLFHYRNLGSQYSNINRRMWSYQRQLFDSVTSRAKSPGCRT